jgi:transcriptional regulator with XRE-family HTH domain
VWWNFGSALFLTRGFRRLDLRSAADLVGISAATLSRAERGHPIAVESYLSIANFIGVPPNSFLCFTGNTNCNTLMSKHFEEAGPDDRGAVLAGVNGNTLSSADTPLSSRPPAS